MSKSWEVEQEPAREPTRRTLRPESLARGLGWFSIALGVAELIAPGAVSRGAGMNEHAGLVRLYGLRELACGLGILASSDPSPFLWARVAGDVADLATLAAAHDDTHERSRERSARAAVNLAAVTALDVYVASRCSDRRALRDRYGRLSGYDYEDRTGFPQAPDQMRGAALKDFTTPRDMRTPEALRGYATGNEDDPHAGMSEEERRRKLH